MIFLAASAAFSATDLLTDRGAATWQAFQHLVGRELVAFADRRPRGDPVEFRPVKLLVTAAEIECALAQHPARSVSDPRALGKIARVG